MSYQNGTRSREEYNDRYNGSRDHFLAAKGSWQKKILRQAGPQIGKKKGALSALIGTAVYTIFYYVLGQGLLPAFIACIVWLLALQKLYTIGWLRAFVIAFFIWIVTTIAGWFLPVL